MVFATTSAPNKKSGPSYLDPQRKYDSVVLFNLPSNLSPEITQNLSHITIV